MAESETTEGEMMPNRLYQVRVVGNKEWTNRNVRSPGAAIIAEAIAVTASKELCEVRPMVMEVRDAELPHDVTFVDVICSVNFVFSRRNLSERN